MPSYFCTLDKAAWQIYEMPGANRAAREISAAVTREVRSALDRLRQDPCLSEHKLAVQVRDKIYRLMADYSRLGFVDTEPSCVLVAELERVFGLARCSLER